MKFKAFQILALAFSLLTISSCDAKKSSGKDLDASDQVSPKFQGDESEGSKNEYPRRNDDGTTDLTSGPDGEDCGFNRYHAISGVISNFDFKPVCYSAEFGWIENETGIPRGEEWAIELDDLLEPRKGTIADIYPKRTVRIEYYGNAGKRIPVEIDHIYERTPIEDNRGFFKVSYLNEERDPRDFDVVEWKIVVLEMPKKKDETLRIRFSLTAHATESEETFEASGEVSLEICNDPDKNNGSCAYWAY